MQSTFNIWKTSRKLYLNYLDKYTIDQLNKIPDGFNNNLIWNIGHVIVAQQSLIYKTSFLEGYVSGEMFDRYKPGTKPTGQIAENEINELRGLLTSLVAHTEQDYAEGKFVKFKERMTGTGFYLGSLKEAFEFNNYHEGMHLGYMMNLRKFV